MQPSARTTLSKQRLCPRCDAQLRLTRYRNVIIDRCARCGGVFFEPGETRHALGEGGDSADWTRAEGVTSIGESSKYCPCRGHRMEGFRLAYRDEQLDLDVCLHCRGVWLDKHETRQLNIVLQAQRTAAGQPIKISRRMAWLNVIAGVPVEEANPVWRRAHWVSGLLVLLLAIYLYELTLVAKDAIDPFVERFALIPARVASGEAWWTLVTSNFVHAAILPFIAILIFLKVFGDNVEDKFGARGLFITFLLSGILGAAAHVLTHPRSPIPIVGADAALAGVIGAYVVLFPRVRIWSFFSARMTALGYAALWVAAQSVAAYVDVLELIPTRVAWVAHLVGFVTGALIALRFRAQRLRRLTMQREVRGAHHSASSPS